MKRDPTLLNSPQPDQTMPSSADKQKRPFNMRPLIQAGRILLAIVTLGISEAIIAISAAISTYRKNRAEKNTQYHSNDVSSVLKSFDGNADSQDKPRTFSVTPKDEQRANRALAKEFRTLMGKDHTYVEDDALSAFKALKEAMPEFAALSKTDKTLFLKTYMDTGADESVQQAIVNGYKALNLYEKELKTFYRTLPEDAAQKAVLVEHYSAMKAENPRFHKLNAHEKETVFKDYVETQAKKLDNGRITSV